MVVHVPSRTPRRVSAARCECSLHGSRLYHIHNHDLTRDHTRLEHEAWRSGGRFAFSFQTLRMKYPDPAVPRFRNFVALRVWSLFFFFHYNARGAAFIHSIKTSIHAIFGIAKEERRRIWIVFFNTLLGFTGRSGKLGRHRDARIVILPSYRIKTTGSRIKI